MVASGFTRLRRDLGAGTDEGSDSSIFGFFVRLEGASFTGSAAISGLAPPTDALRFNDVEGVGVVLGRVLEAAAAAAVAAEESAASLAAERVTLEDMRTSSVLSRRLCPFGQKLARVVEVGDGCKSNEVAARGYSDKGTSLTK